MTKLTKNPPPAYPGKSNSNSPGSLQNAVPYENLPQGTQPPVPVTTAVLPSSYNDPLPDTNPFSPNFNPGPVSNASQQPMLFSPVSPIAESEPIERSAQAPVQAPKPQRPNADQRKSVDLRRLDGKPYPGSNPAPEKEKPKIVKVAKDMHDGALPPVYKRQASDPINPSEVASALSNTHKCGNCGKKHGQSNGHGHSCNQCGKRKSNAPESTPPAFAPVPMPTAATHARTFSEGQASHGSSSRLSESTAGLSGSPSSSTGTRCCTKCGRYKRPAPVPNPFDQLRPNGSGPATAPMPMANHPAMRPGLSIQPNAPGNNPAYPKIDVIPPSASTYKAVNSPFSNYGDDSPLVSKATKQEFKLFRNSSLARSLSRRLSKKDKTPASAAAAPLPSQQLARQSGEQSAGTLINMISTAMQGPGNERDPQYCKLTAGGEPADRPQTPFSFVGGKDEQDAFEMVDLRDRTSVSSHASQDSMKEVLGPQISVTQSDSEYQTGVPDHIDVIPRSRSVEAQRDQHLSVNGAENRPPITRFKSLRQGVSRMGSVSRSTSLKRLGSLKTVHHAWYVEGTDGNNENIVPVF
ncbi:uncharacterized protein A1O5_01208 [Cladophialophora psammophila CBS 110553]|uniref:Uncharacterized protein n=1 Tax=Cladophialophora psammophila CBS 110553 TaxID=1182543 RepID=W9XH73_9EURO|nr:uncharacterized protein A1O5_01208 [Cladophialophora psammophila CBS 110553]EXJ76700.1 hypothetical protein A1O5_01208 [Cladophialophora psammophila CBS 110553]